MPALLLVLGMILLYLPSASAAKQTPRNTFASPDFAYPKTVAANADKALQKALSDGDDVNVVRALIQLTIADNDVSADNLPARLQAISDVAAKSSGERLAVLRLLQARLLNEVYQSDSYKYSNRNLPTDSFPADPTLWSKDLFALRIHSLVNDALADEAMLARADYSKWAPVFTPLDELSAQFYPDLYAVMSSIGRGTLSNYTDATQVIPFTAAENIQSPGRKCAALSNSIVSKNIEMARADHNPAWLSVWIKNEKGSADPEQRLKQVLGLYKEYAASPYSCELLLAASEITGLSDADNALLETLLTEAVERYPDYPRINALRNALANMQRAYADLRVPGQVIPRKEFDMIVKTRGKHGQLYAQIYAVDNGNSDLRKYLQTGKGKFIGAYPVTGDTSTMHITLDKPGTYAAVMAGSNVAHKNLMLDAYPVTFEASGLEAYYSSGAESCEDSRLYILDALNGKPLSGVEVTLTRSAYKKPTLTEKLKTNSEGWVAVGAPKQGYRDCTYLAQLRGDKIENSIYQYVNQPSRPGATARIFPSLSIYKPGAECDFAVVMAEQGLDTRRLLTAYPIEVRLLNASGQDVDTLQLTTDSEGRAIGRFTLPKDGMMGTFGITVYSADGKKHLGYETIRVEEYRVPGFYVNLESGKPAYKLGDSVELTGEVRSYSGMAMPGSSVNITVNYRQPWWRRYSATGTYSATVTTDESGNFKLTLPTSALKDTPYAAGAFEVVAEVTSAAGETCRSNTAVFSLGNLARVMITSPSSIKVTDKTVKFTAKAEDLPDSAALSYKLVSADGKEVASGDFPLTGLSLPAAQLLSGEYKLTVSIPGVEPAADSASIVIWRPGDARPPVNTPLWIPENSYVAEPGAKTVDIIFGSTATEQSVLVTVADEHKILSRQTVVLTDCNRRVSVPVPADGHKNFVCLFTVNDAKCYPATIEVNAPHRELKMQVKSFRDKIFAGGKERWSFSYVGENVSAADMPVIATLSDKALNALVPFSWQWIEYSFLSQGVNTSYWSTGLMGNTFSLGDSTPYTYPAVTVPGFYTWGRSMYPVQTIYVRGTRRMYAAAAPTAAPAAGANMMMMKQSQTADSAAAIEESVKVEGADEGGALPAADVQLRPAELPLAWFKPALITDGKGLLEISFDVPDFNTTWQLQLLAYTRDLITTNSVLYTVASKPVMVKSVVPRFLRTGDKARLTATLFNNTDAVASPEAEVIIFNPLDNRVIASRKYEAQPLDSMRQRVLDIELTVPADVQTLGYKVLARSGEYSDGEQSLIGILPSSSPVTEGYPFYLSPGQDEFTMQFPELREGSAALQYCDNPVWYCVTALPTVAAEQNASVLSVANSLFANAITAHLVGKYPRITEAVELWKATSDSTLMSALERDPQLKAVMLSATPWVTNAESETLRMAQLASFISNSKAASEEAIKALIDRVNPDGGWSWCDGMPSSEYITRRVLAQLAKLKDIGALPAGSELAAVIDKAIGYCETQIIRQTAGTKNVDAESLMNWFYIRSFFPAPNSTDTKSPVAVMKALKTSCIKKIRANWKNYSIADAATAAILLYRDGYPMQAREILESLRQRAETAAEKGMWYANFQNDFSGLSTLLTTTRVLEAFTDISPDSPCIEPLVQWLVLERQARDWGGSASVAEVVWAIINGAPKWTEPSEPAQIELNGKRLYISKMSALTGAITLPLDASEASRAQLAISRSSQSPAWGGIITRYIAPIEDVKDFSNGAVSVTKRLLLVVQDEAGTHTENVGDRPLKSGDKVRVQLTVESARDIDYAVITDEQCGCLMPADQLSGYKYGGEVGYYREVRTGVTNFFIPRLHKGKFLVEYDCYVEGEGTYASGIATLQSLYAPSLTAHSAGSDVHVQ